MSCWQSHEQCFGATWRSELMELVLESMGALVNFSKAVTNFVWVCIIMLIIITCLLMEKKSLNVKPTMKLLPF